MYRIMVVLALVFGVSLADVSDLSAQRSGFIIGFGVGLGVTSYSYSGFDREGDTTGGLATDLKVGAQVSQSLQVYYLGRTNWLELNGDRGRVAAGISALGATYVLPATPVHVSGGIGVANWLGFKLDHADGGLNYGLGLTGGIGWEFADRWLVDLALTYGRPSDRGGHVNMFLARVGFSVLSH